MRKILLLLIICLAGSSVIKAQTIPQLQQGVYENDTLTEYIYNLNDSCSFSISVDLSLYPIAFGVNLKLVIDQLNFPPRSISANSNTISVGDVLSFGSNSGYSFYTTASGSIKLKLIIEGTPTLSGQSYACMITDTLVVIGDPFLPCSFNFRTLYGIQNSCTVSNPIGINELPHQFNFNISPNPSSGDFKIYYLLPQNKEGKLEVFDITGKVVYEMRLPRWSTLQQILLPKNLCTGIYSVIIRSGNSIATKKLVISE